MDDRKLRHDYISSVQSLKNFVHLVAEGKLEADADFTPAIIEEARRAVAFLNNEVVVERISFQREALVTVEEPTRRR